MEKKAHAQRRLEGDVRNRISQSHLLPIEEAAFEPKQRLSHYQCVDSNQFSALTSGIGIFS